MNKSINENKNNKAYGNNGLKKISRALLLRLGWH